MNRPLPLLAALALAVAAIYLFVTAPPPLPEDPAAADSASRVDIETVLRTVAAENDVMRSLYTRELVAKGPAVGLRFDEFWRDEAVEAGPLPALFLRETAASLQRSGIPLGLFLGSDFPIAPSNRFEGAQAEAFAALKADREPRFFYADDVGRHTAMFPDLASAKACVDCHNEHPESPKTDWSLNDVMGATTWTYPEASVSLADYLAMIRAVRAGFRSAYEAYLAEVATFEKPPDIGDQWPEAGYNLPSADVFMAEFERRAGPATVNRLLSTKTQPDS